MLNNDGFMDTYARTGLVFLSGKGALLKEESGRDFIDFSSGIGVSSMGHGHPALVKAISEQAGRLIHISNYHQSDTARAFASELLAISGYDRVFLCNSGAEANEAAIKIARKRGESMAQPGGPARKKIVALQQSFHGRTIATLAATGQEKYRQGFGPFPEGFVHVPAGDIAALEKALGPDTAALLLEPIQGEGGVYPLPQEYLEAAAALSAERGALLIADEVQCGVGRTGYFLASEAAGIKPDLVTLAKGLAGGVPIGAVLAKSAAGAVLGRGEHGTTFGGNPLAAAAGRAVLAELSSPGFMAAVSEKGRKIAEAVRSWNHPAVKDIRGRGLMIGIVLGLPPQEVKHACQDAGLLVLTAGEDVLRLLPPLVITDEELMRGLILLRAGLDHALEESRARS